MPGRSENMDMIFKDGKKKALTLSYDDGYVFDRRLMAIFDKYGLKATFNISTGRYYPEDGEDKDFRIMKLSEAKRLYTDSPHELAIHGYSHKALKDLEPEQIEAEILSDKLFAEREYGRRITGMAYPYGACDKTVFSVAEKCGIRYSRGKDTGNFSLPENRYEFNPTCHHDDPKLFELAEKFVNGDPGSQNWLFFVWGHSSELEKNNNWDRMY